MESEHEIKNENQHEEAPENGLKGLKHWRQDMFAGFIIALVSVPLSLGIALASGAPPICGITSEIIAGLKITVGHLVLDSTLAYKLQQAANQAQRNL